jgi:urocanate hydratase
MDEVVKSALSWDVMGGVARRNWARNPNAIKTSSEWNLRHQSDGQITIPFDTDESMINDLVTKVFGG